MNEIKLSSWEAFEKELQRLQDERAQKKYRSNFLYRGQGDHNYKLSTTLERNDKLEMPLRDYHHLIYTVKPEIESFTGRDWNILSYPKGIDRWLTDNDTVMPNAFGCSPEFQSTYSYMTYLRHFGFPSPFLDWSGSPYVAAFFAFRQPSRCNTDVAIYAYLESTSEIGLKGASYNEPQIHRFGPYVRSDRRHFLQQSQYTICIIGAGGWRYSSHEGVFISGESSQDVLWKFIIPYSERLKVLKKLEEYNINALSLFGTKESLMETMALREIHLKEIDRF